AGPAGVRLGGAARAPRHRRLLVRVESRAARRERRDDGDLRVRPAARGARGRRAGARRVGERVVAVRCRPDRAGRGARDRARRAPGVVARGGGRVVTVRGLRAGAARVPLDPPLGGPMMGYGARQGVARGVRDPLYARALYLAGRDDCVWLELDLCLLARTQADAVRWRVAERTGVPPARVLVACTHTHSGPETGLFAALGGAPTPPAAARLLDAAVEAAARARASAGPARLGVGRGEAHIGRNRRRADGPVDPEVLVVRVDREDGAPLAVLYVHGCH